MKPFVLLCFAVAAAAAQVPGPVPHTILTCNIRLATPADESPHTSWDGRRELCFEVIREQQPDIICLQEVLRVQNDDLARAFQAFDSFGFDGPEMDARREGYHGITKNVILFSRERYELVSAGGFWLSETPHLPGSQSWDAARPRHVNWLRLRERATGREFRVLDAHLDHLGQRAREQQMKMIVAEAALYIPDFPQFLVGDFNADSTNPAVKLAIDAGWGDTHLTAPGTPDPGRTYHAFQGENYAPKSAASRARGRIDFILARGPVRTLASRIIRNHRGDLFPSDHYFVAARVVFQ